MTFISVVPTQGGSSHVAAVVSDDLCHQILGVVRVIQGHTVSTLPPVLPPVLVDRFGGLLREAAQSPVAPAENGDMGQHSVHLGRHRNVERQVPAPERLQPLVQVFRQLPSKATCPDFVECLHGFKRRAGGRSCRGVGLEDVPEPVSGGQNLLTLRAIQLARLLPAVADG